MKSPKNTTLYSRLALITSVTLVVGYFVVYAAWSGILDSEIAPSAVVTSTLMTKIKNNLEYLSGGLANFGFSSGNVGIGTTSPGTKLHVWNSVDNNIMQLRAAGHSGINGMIIGGGYNVTAGNFLSIKDSTGANDFFLVTNGGNVGIGTTTPTVKLEVNGKFTAQDTIQFQGGAKIRQMVVKRGTLPNANGGPYYGFGPAFPKAVLDSSKCIGFATPVGALTGTSILVTWAGMADSVNSYFSCSNCTASTQFSFMVIEYE